MALFFKSRAGAKHDSARPAAPKPHVPPPDKPVVIDRGEPLPADPVIEERTRALGAELLDAARRNKTGVLSAQFWSDKLMDWSMQDEAFKVQLFRFVDAFPMLRTPEQVHEHLADYLTQPGVTPPPGLDLGLRVGGLAKGLMTRTVAGQITGMAEKFIAGTDAKSALPKLKRLWNDGLAFSVDLLGEACVSDAEAIDYRRKYLDLIENLPREVASWPANPRLERDHLGPIPRCNVSIKISSLNARTDPIDTEGSIRGLMDGIVPILEAARRHGVLINFDMEQFALKDLTLELFMRCCEAVDFEAGLAMQAYLRSGDDDARRIVDWSKRTGRAVTVRLVKGAYWDYETINAEQQGWTVPVWSRKADTDACFERMTGAFVASMPRRSGEGGVKLALGSHNARSIALAMAQLERHDLPREALELQMLHGMADQLKAAAVEMGMRVREYVPVGEMIPGMAYLVRRLLENTSNESWLKAGFLDNASVDQLLASPHRRYERDPGVQRIAEAPERHQLSVAVDGVGDGRPFHTEPMRNFADQAQRALRRGHRPQRRAGRCQRRDGGPGRGGGRAAARVLSDLARHRAARAGGGAGARRPGDARSPGRALRRGDPRVGQAVARGGRRRVRGDRLLRLLRPHGGADVRARTAGSVHRRARRAVVPAARRGRGDQPVELPARDLRGHGDRGPGVRQHGGGQAGRADARHREDPLRDPVGSRRARDALAFLPGIGETVGAALVRHPKVALVAFTGSMAVGLDIIAAAGQTDPKRQSEVKKVVCEMGGKNAVIVDASADLDEAVLGVRQSAFGFSGQKCSACSRVIVVESAYDDFVRRLVESTRSLVVGDPMLPGTDVGPVIDADAARRIRSYIEIGRQEGTVEIELPVPDGLEARVGKPYVGPTIVSGITQDDRLANEEIFGPVLAVIRAKDFDDALRMANATAYKLTGGVFSRKPSHLDRARRAYRVGNLYLNRGITGALVGRQPFGGFGMSGVGSKAGGRDYLLQFVEPRAVCENTMRRGFAPGL